MVSTMCSEMPSLSLTSTFLSWSRLVTPNIARRHHTSKTNNFLLSSSRKVQVSEALMAIGLIRQLYSRIFKRNDTPFYCKTDLRSLQNDVVDKALLLKTSSPVSGTTLPRRRKLSTFSTTAPSIRIGLSFCDNSLYLSTFIFIPYLAQAFSSSAVDSCNLSNIADIRVVSSAYLMSIDMSMAYVRVWSSDHRSIITNLRKTFTISLP